MNEAVIQRILDAYHISYQQILPPQKGYRNETRPVLLHDKTSLNLILYKSEPGILERIKTANRVSDFLHELGFPTRCTQDKIIELRVGERLKYGAVYNYLPGETIPWEAYTREHIKNLGGMMSKMHAALAQYHGQTPSIILEYQANVRRMQHYFGRATIQRALQRKLGLSIAVPASFADLLEAAGELPAQTLHMDFVRGNILFDGSAIVGVLDFEKTAHGPRVFDIARTLAFLLVDCKYKEEAKIRKYFLKSGYNKRGRASFTDTTVNFAGGYSSLLEGLVNVCLLYDFYKFLRHNPYEDLPDNEHFIRTRNLVVSRQIIAYNKSIERVVTRG